MKIKIVNKSYAEVKTLPSLEHKKPKKPSKLLATVARMGLQGELKQTGFTCEKVDMEKAIVAKIRIAAEEIYKMGKKSI